MKRRDFIKFAGAVPFAIGHLKNIGAAEMSQRSSMSAAMNCADLLSNLSNGDHLIIGSRPNMGKTTLMLNLLLDLAIKQNSSCALFSLELVKEQAMERLICIEANVSLNQMRAGKLSDAEFQRIIKASSKLSKSDIFIDDSAGMTVEEMSRKLNRLKKSGKDIKYIFVDYLQLLGAERKYNCRRDHADDVLLQLKQLAINQNAIVISTGQLNRSSMGRIDRRPILTDLRENSDYSNIDKAIYLYREDYYDRDQNGPLELNVVKSKNHKKSFYEASVDKQSFKISNLRRIDKE